ncbi:MAG: metal ABC transporter substrate-binding protein [Acidimicrobiales bacterium]|nr:metal ABC transporter substrate-binding protein [Acidimicrobiales bacterium]
MKRRFRLLPILVGVAGLLFAACGDDESADAAAGDDAKPTVVVTTNILGDVVESFAGNEIDVITIMPVGADPHDFQPSAQQANEMRQADALVVNGAGFEDGLQDVIDAATDDGVPTYEAIAAIDTIDFSENDHDHDDHADEDEVHADADHADEDHDDHDHDGEDPHFFTDPTRVALSVDGMTEFLIETVDGIDAEALRVAADAAIDDLEALDTDVEALLAGIPEERRVLVTNHEVFGYFADRYDFELVGTVIPGGSTTDGASAGALADLADLIEDEGVPAIFADTSSSNELADTLASEVGDIAVVELFSESLGDADSDGATYLDMVRANAQRIADALA